MEEFDSLLFLTSGVRWIFSQDKRILPMFSIGLFTYVNSVYITPLQLDAFNSLWYVFVCMGAFSWYPLRPSIFLGLYLVLGRSCSLYSCMNDLCIPRTRLYALSRNSCQFKSTRVCMIWSCKEIFKDIWLDGCF